MPLTTTSEDHLKQLGHDFSKQTLLFSFSNVLLHKRSAAHLHFKEEKADILRKMSRDRSHPPPHAVCLRWYLLCLQENNQPQSNYGNIWRSHSQQIKQKIVVFATLLARKLILVNWKSQNVPTHKRWLEEVKVKAGETEILLSRLYEEFLQRVAAICGIFQ